MRRSVVQDWVNELPAMQQTVLLEMVRGPDTVEKYHISKYLLRWYRRCLLYSALDGRVLTNPYEPVGGSFTGPSFDIEKYLTNNENVHEVANIRAGNFDWVPEMDGIVSEYLRGLDALPIHAVLHFMQAVEIMGYNHPDPVIRQWWHNVYIRFVHNFHLWPETKEQLGRRLGDTREGWLERGDPATLT